MPVRFTHPRRVRGDRPPAAVSFGVRETYDVDDDGHFEVPTDRADVVRRKLVDAYGDELVESDRDDRDNRDDRADDPGDQDDVELDELGLNELKERYRSLEVSDEIDDGVDLRKTDSIIAGIRAHQAATEGGD